MAAGDITSTITECDGTAAIKTYLDSESTGAATEGTSITSFQVLWSGRDKIFYVVKIERESP